MMRSTAQKMLEDAVDVAGLRGMTARQRRMNLASKVYWGEQYSHLPAWDDPSAKNKPLRQKAPRIHYRLVYRAINELVGYLFGRDRAPRLVIEGSTDPETGESTTNDNELRELNAVLETLYGDTDEGAGVKHYLTNVGRLAGLHGSVAVGVHARPGRTDAETRWSTEVIETSLCKPTFGRDNFAQAARLGIADDDLLELDEYWYRIEEDPVWGDQTLWLHRRQWLPDQTLEYLPVKVSEVHARSELSWKIDEGASHMHDLGFVPVEWIPNLLVVNDIDGAPFLDVPEFSLEDAVNYTMSQLDRGIAYNQEPLTVFEGVNASQWDKIKRGSGNTLALPPAPNGGEVSASLLELEGTGQEVALDYVAQLRASLYEVAQIVMHNPEEAQNLQSGTALERALRPTLMRIHEARPTYSRGLSRLGRKMLMIAGYDQQKVTASWGPLVHPTATDALMTQQAAIQARDADGITDQTFIEKIAPFYNIDNVEEYLEQLQSSRVQGGTVSRAPEDEGRPQTFGVSNL